MKKRTFELYILLLIYGIGCTSMTSAVFLPFLQQSNVQSSTTTATSQSNEAVVLADSRHKTIEYMSYHELEANKNYWKQQNAPERVIIYLRMMLARCDNISTRADLLLELADELFVMQKSVDSQREYQEFCALFQGHEKIAYARYRLILCCNAQLLSYDRDQSMARNLITLCDEFACEHEGSELIGQVKTLRAHARQLLAESELYVMEQYVVQRKYASAARRFRYFNNEFEDVDQSLFVQAKQVCDLLQEATGHTPDELIAQQEARVLGDVAST